MTPKKKSTASTNKNISISGDVVDSTVFIGDNNTLIQKFFNIFKSDSETLEHRNRRILLGHVENAWIKGVLDASLHGAALLDLGIKQDPEAVTKYPWAIKKESTDETLPAGTSMLEIFDSIGMGRSLLILGAPGSGKTTMLLELARQLIQHAREDVTQPIPMVFNLASWTEKLSLADWLAQELNNLYSVPRKTAPDWVKGDKLLLLLDGLDEVRQDSRAKCVEAINTFRKEHGLTSLAVCSRTQDYADLNKKLSFEGAIEVQPLTQKQITEFFNRFGKEMAGIKQVLKKDGALREMAETPLFLGIMMMAYRDKRGVDILVSQNEKEQRKHLFDTYIECMLERPRLKNVLSQKQDILKQLSWLADKMIKHVLVPYLIEDMQPDWLGYKKQISKYYFICGLIFGLFSGLFGGLINGLFGWLLFNGLLGMVLSGLVGGLFFGLNIFRLIYAEDSPIGRRIKTIDILTWSWNDAISGFFTMIIAVPLLGLIGGLFGMLRDGLVVGLFLGLIGGLAIGLVGGMKIEQIDRTIAPAQRISFSLKNSIFVLIASGLVSALLFAMTIFGLREGLHTGLISTQIIEPINQPSIDPGGSGDPYVRLILEPIGEMMIGPISGMIGLFCALLFGGATVIQHYTLRLLLYRNNLLPWRLVPFLDHCVDLIFLRRVGGGYIFVHRLLMEHFAEMYVESPTLKGN